MVFLAVMVAVNVFSNLLFGAPNLWMHMQIGAFDYRTFLIVQYAFALIAMLICLPWGRLTSTTVRA